jgi:RNA polymerase sigma factor (sigma-70 family)
VTTLVTSFLGKSRHIVLKKKDSLTKARAGSLRPLSEGLWRRATINSRDQGRITVKSRHYVKYHGVSSSMENGEFVKLCADSGDVVAWQEFVRRFHRPIAQAVLRELRRYGRSATEAADDLIQETYLKLCADNLRIIRDFEHKQPDSFISFLRVVASNIVRDHFKAYYSQKRKGNLVDQLVDESVAVINDEGYGTPRSIEREVLIAEIRRYLEDCVPKTRHRELDYSDLSVP